MRRFFATIAALLLVGACTDSNDGNGYTPPNLGSQSDALSISDEPLTDDEATGGSFPGEGRFLGWVFQAAGGEILDIVLTRTSGTAVPAEAIYTSKGGVWTGPLAWASADAREIGIRGWTVPTTGTYLILVDVVSDDREGTFQISMSCTESCEDDVVCTSDSDCPAAQICWEGLCFEPNVECTTDADCKPHEVCEASFCVAHCQPAVEICDGIDNDCDGEVDEECDFTPCTAGADCAAGEVCENGECVPACLCASDADCPIGALCVACQCVTDNCPDSDADGHASCRGDCNDNDAAVHPGAIEACNDGLDNDCDGVVDEGCGGRPCAASSDCQAGQACVGGICVDLPCTSDVECPAGEVCWDGVCVGDFGCIDDSQCPAGTVCDATTGQCTGVCDDVDLDGYCAASDCDDSDASVHPGAPEDCTNGRDDDCDGAIDEGCGGQPCTSSMDCAAGEVCVNGLCSADFGCTSDSDCPTGMQCDAATATCQSACDDNDADGYCAPYDCNDADPTVHPGNAEVCDNGLDDDCDGIVDDGCQSCTDDSSCPAGQVCIGGECTSDLPCTSDMDCPFRHSCVAGICVEDYGCSSDSDCPSGQICDATTATCVDDGTRCTTDSDCAAGQRCESGVCVADCTDSDQDGFCADVDCNDNDASVNPGAAEVCSNGIDEDCDGMADEGCGNPCTSGEDCAAGEVCEAGVCVASSWPCSSDSDCPTGQICDAASATCVAAP